ncbi:low temperature requirement protein A [Naasia lichenicola]|uniref:Low temperature requirement protein A n=2 Tax=Naasia lichenicola TaxID=2565933 RepID=A0A4S4FM06_9MICO|nr:low temperature requirement protein A [Naasia lichenicola]
MTARETREAHRVSSPLELLVDLVFVVAVAQLAAALAHSVEEGHLLEGILPFVMVFFAIWWAWMNFTWFASAYDTDDVPYRLLTLVQMAGALIIAASAARAFEGEYAGATIGYLVMRVGLVSQWIRAGIQHPEGRTTAFRYAGGITAVQVLWFARLLLPYEVQFPAFFLVAILDMAVPAWAERSGRTSWHPHHIAERYGLFVIILLGESVLAATVAFAQAELTPSLAAVGLSGLVILFALWWIYFLQPVGDGLAARPDRSFWWGYGHYFLFAALASIGAGLEVAVVTIGHAAAEVDHALAAGAAMAAEEGEAVVGSVAAALGIAVPVAIALVMMWALHGPLGIRSLVRAPVALGGAAAIVAAALLAGSIGLAAAIAATAGILVLVVASEYLPRSAPPRSAGSGQIAGSSSVS